MTDKMDRAQQVVQVHAPFILQIVQSCFNSSLQTHSTYALKKAEENGWENLARVARQILDGRRDESLLLGLDEEDSAIIHAILTGIQNPETLPDPHAQADPNQAAPNIANLVRAAMHNDLNALQAASNMAEQLSTAGGDMAIIAAHIRPLIQGERDANKLCADLSAPGETLMLAILKALEE